MQLGALFKDPTITVSCGQAVRDMESRQDIKKTNSIQLIRPRGHPRTLPAGPSSSELLPGLSALICSSQLYPDLCPTHSAVSASPLPSLIPPVLDASQTASDSLGLTCLLGSEPLAQPWGPGIAVLIILLSWFPAVWGQPLRLCPQFPDWDEPSSWGAGIWLLQPLLKEPGGKGSCFKEPTLPNRG